MKYLITAAIALPVVFGGTLALAHSSGMMGSTMGQGMQGCMQMMQDMNSGGSRLPNEQWRRGQVAPGREKPGPEPHANHRRNERSTMEAYIPTGDANTIVSNMPRSGQRMRPRKR